jgi:hypothetical protein
MNIVELLPAKLMLAILFRPFGFIAPKTILSVCLSIVFSVRLQIMALNYSFDDFKLFL